MKFLKMLSGLTAALGCTLATIECAVPKYTFREVYWRSCSLFAGVPQEGERDATRMENDAERLGRLRTYMHS